MTPHSERVNAPTTIDGRWQHRSKRPGARPEALAEGRHHDRGYLSSGRSIDLLADADKTLAITMARVREKGLLDRLDADPLEGLDLDTPQQREKSRHHGNGD